MKELNRFEMAAVKRTAQNVKKFLKTQACLEAKMTKISEDLAQLKDSIDAWETPIKLMTGGFTSTEVLEMNGILPTNEDITVPEEDENIPEPVITDEFNTNNE